MWHNRCGSGKAEPGKAVTAKSVAGHPMRGALAAPASAEAAVATEPAEGSKDARLGVMPASPPARERTNGLCKQLVSAKGSFDQKGVVQ